MKVQEPGLNLRFAQFARAGFLDHEKQSESPGDNLPFSQCKLFMLNPGCLGVMRLLSDNPWFAGLKKGLVLLVQIHQ